MSAGAMAGAEGSPEGPALGLGFDPYEQARKALSLRTPFEEETAPRVPTLPARLVSWAGPSDRRKKHKKLEPPDAAAEEHPPKLPAAPSGKKGAWEHFEAYFRPVTLNDIEMLMPRFPFCRGELDSCIVVPLPGSRSSSSEELVEETYDVAVAETSSYLGVGGEEVVCNKERSAQSADFVSNVSTEQGIHDVVVQQLDCPRDRSEQSIEQRMHEVVAQREEWPLEVEQGSSSGGTASPVCEEEEEEEAGTSLNWLLGARQRVVLTTERPNKKRKLLGVDAGLEKLVLLPRLGARAESMCDVCCLGQSGMASNRMLRCSSCKASVHQKCYGVHAVPKGKWLCAWCKYVESAGVSSKKEAASTLSMPCVLCPKGKGALKPAKTEPNRTADGGNLQFAHLFCSLWRPEVLVEDMDSMEPVTNIGSVQENPIKMVCTICKVKRGSCRAAFHPICARDSKHQMEIWGKFGHPNVELRAFCSKHSSVGYVNSLEKSNNTSEQGAREVRTKDANLSIGKIPKLRFTRKNKDRSMNYETGSFNPDSLIKVETMEHGALPRTVRSSDTQATRNMEMDTDHPSVSNLMRNSGDIAMVLKKLIDRGDVSVSDIASEVGISSASFEAALVGETTTFSHGLKLKIIKWLQKSAHIPAVEAIPLKESSEVVQEDKLDGSEGTNSVNVTISLVPVDKEAAVEMSVSTVPELSPPRSNAKVLKEEKAICATGTTLENGKKDMAKGSADDFSKDFIRNLSPVGNKDTSKAVHEKLEKIAYLWDHTFKQNKQAQYHSEGQLCSSSEKRHVDSSIELMETTEIDVADQISKAKSLGILDHSPDDEVEGEMVFLQARLLDNAMVLKHRYEDLIVKVVQNLSRELNVFSKRKWDFILVNHFLRDVREAKKRGRKEKRHKEAQAVLAEAAAAVAASSRNSTISPNFGAGSSRVAQRTPSLPRPKDSSKPSNSKVSPVTNFGTFHMPILSKENALYCDVCLRSESVLNRIFVCSRCKAAVHIDCYRNLGISIGPWKCELCEDISSEAVSSSGEADCNDKYVSLVRCALCHGTSGAFRKTIDDQWIHAFCAEWLLETKYMRGQDNPVSGMETLLREKDTCCVCISKVGVCLKCNSEGCQTTFHPSCARDAGFYMNIKGFGTTLQHKAYCAKHSTEQKETDAWQYGPEELNSLKRMRVSLPDTYLLILNCI
ncbi:hypothetical protein ACQ4PT_003056 [Festuca glaucescens]